MLSAAKEEMALAALIEPGVLFPLAAFEGVAENSRQGITTKNPTLHQGSNGVISTTALGMQPVLRWEGVRSRYTGKERDSESNLDNFEARYYSSAQGRMMSPDPSPDGVDVADPQSWNLYSYVRNRPTRAVDVGGNWATDVHAEITTFALQGYVSAGELRSLVSEQYVMDNDQSDQSHHAMANPGQSPGAASDAWQHYVVSKLDSVSAELTPDGNFTSDAIRTLGDAIHTLQDYTSPMHTFPNGNPMVWYGMADPVGSLHHITGESSANRDWSAIGQAVRLTMLAYMQGNPELAAKHGLTGTTFEQQANQRISNYVSSFYSQQINLNLRPIEEDAARLCALGNPAACD